jgi:hypothetical protein
LHDIAADEAAAITLARDFQISRAGDWSLPRLAKTAQPAIYFSLLELQWS